MNWQIGDGIDAPCDFFRHIPLAIQFNTVDDSIDTCRISIRTFPVVSSAEYGDAAEEIPKGSGYFVRIGWKGFVRFVGRITDQVSSLDYDGVVVLTPH
jgi:hypothetical protein